MNIRMIALKIYAFAINVYRFSCLNKTLGLSYSQTSPLIKFEPFML